MKLNELGEGGWINRIRNRFKNANAIVGIGDDAAIVDLPAGYSMVYCSDLVVEGTHFLRALHPPDSIGYKAVAVNVSDVGAMGGVPTHFLISIAVPADLEVEWLDGFLDGVERASREFNVSLVGGDSSLAKSIFVDVSMIGRVPVGRAVQRSGAQPGDRVYVSGALGGSALGLDRLRAGDRNHPSVQRHLYPTPRYKVGEAVADRARAMIDISDGLSTDLGHILEESNVSARIHKHLIPRIPGASDGQVLHGGEEYELLITAPSLPSDVGGVPLTPIGEIIPFNKHGRLFLIDGDTETVLQPSGYNHFS